MSKAIVGVIAIAVAAGGAWVLLGDNQPSDVSPTDTGDTAPAEGVPPANNEDAAAAGEEQTDSQNATVAGLFRKVDNASCRYDMTVNPASGDSQTVTAWMKGDNVRIEGSLQGQSGVYLLNRGDRTARLYLPDRGQAMKINYEQVSQMTPTPSEESQSGESQDIESDYSITGSETIQGRNTVIVESNDGATKMWMWTQNGLPLKTENVTEGGTSVTEVTSIDCGSIPDDKFSLPEGVEVMEMPTGF